MAKLFGFSIDDQDNKSKSIVSPVPKTNEDGVDYYLQSGFYGQYVDIEGVYRTESDLIKRYREMALHPECDNAIEDVVNEAIVSDLYDSPIEIELSNLNASDKVKTAIRKEFRYIKDIMDFDKKCHEIFRNWYVDGRIYYMKVIDLKAPEEGIKEIRYIDPMKIKYVRQERKKDRNALVPQESTKNPFSAFPEIDEYYMYTPSPKTPMGGKKDNIKIAKDAIAYCTSGLVDRNKGTVLSYLHKAIKGLNQLRMIDVGNLPKVKAEQYLRDVMMRYRNKMVYDANTGEIRDDRKHMSMLEDFWLPRREGGRGTEITTLPGGQNLGELSDIEYFQKKLYRALGVPESRIANDGGFNLGRSSEILRDELKFSKFVGRLRKRFSNIFSDLLKTQLILKNIIAPEDWDIISDHIQYDYLYDNQFAELKETEMLNERLTILSTIEPFIGRYYSQEWVRRKVLRQTDTEMEEMDKQIEAEIKTGIIPDPNSIDPVTGEPLEGGPQMLGDVPMEPKINAGVTDAQAQKDTKSAEI